MWTYPAGRSIEELESPRVSSQALATIPDDGNLPVRQFQGSLNISWYKRLGHAGLYPRRPVRCVPLTATRGRLRLTWSTEHAFWTPQQWSCVMFSDESRFSLHSAIVAGL
ncbi:transposable element Tcb1 transposase [Trichonephila clavipes]|nr:transposable element Tcb1 transposase [Trichonephila clavipes]